MRFRVVCLTLFGMIWSPRFCVWAQAGSVYFPPANYCFDNHEASTADQLPIQGSCSFDTGYNGIVRDYVSGQATVDQSFSLTTAVTSEVDILQGSGMSLYVDVQSGLRDSIWFDPAEYPTRLW